MDIIKSILNDIQAEKLCSSPDKHHIQRCQKIIDNLDSLSLNEFIDTGHIMPIKQIQKRYPNIKLRDDAVSVCRYVGGFCIQFVGRNKFFWNYHEDVDIKHIEMTLFNHIITLIDEQ